MEKITLWLNEEQHRILYQTLSKRKQQLNESLIGKSSIHHVVMQHEIQLMNQVLTQLMESTITKPEPIQL
ncbi:hypothetical protein [Seinonella peptonophila]|uniref:hypothetical protein n=1 Tax=Seinonella peptonophila TaxID=112248 RepID=UPI0009349783|nr:hypothetical protein [Seinonella peptonophila]